MNTTIVGRFEHVDLPKLGILNVPAKVDTGADSSSIWATNIEKKGDKLSFVLFDRRSPYYTGETITTTKFTVSTIKNSFGHSESRYKVPITAVIAGRTIHVRFTLANRANNRFPILIGRRTLHGKFVVDVTRAPAPDELEVLLLTTDLSSAVVQLAKNLEAADELLRVRTTTYRDLVFKIGGSDTQIIDTRTGRDIATFDMGYFKTTARHLDIAAAAAQHLQKKGVPITDGATMQFPSSSKLYQYILLTNNDVAIPESVFVMNERLEGFYEEFVDTLGLPFVLKDIHGSRGNYNYMIKTRAAYDKAVQEIVENGVQVVAQKFVPNEGDYRVLVFGTKIGLIIFRSRPHDKTHLNNTSQGGTAKLVELTDLPTKVQYSSIIAAKTMQRRIAGVDMVQDSSTGEWYCFEVNDGPQVATGSYTDEKQAALAEFLHQEIMKQYGA